MSHSHRRLSGYRLQEMVDRVDARRAEWASFTGPEYDAIRQANNDIIELVVELRNDRSAHEREINALGSVLKSVDRLLSAVKLVEHRAEHVIYDMNDYEAEKHNNPG